jgi:hypothetical protein
MCGGRGGGGGEAIRKAQQKNRGAEIKAGGGTNIARNMSIIVLRIWRWRLH